MAARSSTARSVALIALLASCDRGRETERAPETKGGPPPLAQKAFYRIDARPLSPCTVGRTCEAQLVLTALGAYHVNAEYPTKFVADPASEVPVGDASFKVSGEKSGTLTVRFTPAKPGTAKLVGTFKLSVCTEENCEIEAPTIALDVPAT